MYGKLWSFVNHYIDADHALAVYLPILIVGWTIIGTLFGLGVCSAIRIDLIQSLGRYPLCRRIRRNFPGTFRGNPLLVSEIKFSVEFLFEYRTKSDSSI